MQLIQDWDKSRLAIYLLYGHWEPYNACRVLAGLEYQDKGPDNEAALNNGQLEIGEFDYFCELREMTATVDQLREFWISDLRDSAVAPPAVFIDWAVSKRFRPAWLDWAIERDLYIPKHGAGENNIAHAGNGVAYSSKWLEIQQSAIAQFFNPRRNPDVKKEEVVEWINTQAVSAGLGESKNIASTIFTIIKPENHDPKKKRIEPQQG